MRTILYAFIGCLGFSYLYNLRGARLFWAALGGAVGWAVYLIFGFLEQDIGQCFLAALVLSAYAEMMARLLKKPVTCFVIVALIPLVPGSGIYYTMLYCLQGDVGRFVQEGLHTLGMAGALALGVLLTSSLVRLSSKFLESRRAGRHKE